MHERLVTEAPVFRVHPDFFQIPSSYSRTQNHPASLKELISSRFPDLATKLGFSTPTVEERIPLLDELTPKEFEQVVIARLVANKSGNQYFGENGRLLTNADLIEEIRKKTRDGSGALSAARGGMNLLEKLAAAGKIEILT